MDLERIHDWVDRCLRRASATEKDEGRQASHGQWPSVVPMLPKEPSILHIVGGDEENALNLIASEEDHIMWLSPIDLGGTPRNSHPLMTLLVRIDPIVEFVLDNQGLRQNGREAEDRIRRPWTALKGGAAMGFDSNLPERGARLDPEIYAREMYESARMRQGYDVRFRAFMAALAEGVSNLRQRIDPIFLIPVFNLTARPELVHKLVETLTYLSCARFGFAILGAFDSPAMKRVSAYSLCTVATTAEERRPS